MSDFLPGLEEALYAARTGRGLKHDKRPCAVCVLVRHTKPGERRETLAEAAAGSMSARALRKSLQEVGIRIAKDSLYDHRNERHTP